LTIVVLLILVVVWAVVLVPGLLRRRLERRSGDSIGDFHRQLRILQRTGPTLVDSALRAGAEHHTSAASNRRPSAVVSSRRGLILVRPDAAPPAPLAPAAPAPAARAEPTSTVHRTDPYFHPEACKRRRDVLAGLACVVLGSGLLAVVPMLRPVLGVTAFAALVTAIYVGMLVRMRGRAIERTVKLRYLPEPVAVQPTFAIRRTAAH
jgi:hypothetical protein